MARERDSRQRSSERLLEREEALSALSRVAQAAQAGRGRALFVAGEAGLGKTEVLRRARAERRWTSVGQSAGSPMESGLAFSYLGQALEDLGFAGLVSGAPGSSGTDLRVRLFMAARDWLVEKAADGPVLLALDDLHWADEDSLALLSFLCRRLARAAVAIVATLRPWPDAAAVLAGDLAGAGMAELQSLAPLSDGAVRSLYLAQAPQGRDPAQADVVVRLAAGNPLLVGEAARATGPVAEPGAQATPQMIDAMRRALLLSSFGALAEDARSCAQAGSVLGSPFRLSLVEEVGGLGHDAADAGIGALFAVGLLHGAGAGRAAFHHDLVAEAIYGDMDEGRRRRFHERAWRALAKRGDAALATAHALPADLAGLPEAAQVAHRAGTDALRSGAVSSAVELLKMADALGSPAPDAAVVTSLAEALLSSGRPAEALAACERALSVAGAEAAIRLRALGLMGRAALHCGDQPRAAAAMDRALELAADEDPEAFVAFSADAVNRISLFVGLAPALARLEDLHQRAVSLGASSAGDLDGLRAYLDLQAGHSCDLGLLEEVARTVAETPKTADQSATWNPGAWFVLTSGWVEDFEAAERCYRSLAEQVGTMEPVVYDTTLTFAFSEGLLRQGRIGEAEAMVASAAHASEVISFGADIRLHSRAVFALEMDRSEEAASLATTFQAVADASGMWSLLCWSAHTQGRILLAQGRAKEAADSYRSLAETASAAGLKHPCVVPWAGAALAAFHRSGAQDEVAALVGWLEEASVGSPCRWPRAMAALGRGLLAEDSGNHGASDQAFEEALSLLRSVRLPLELGQVALAYGAALRRRGQRSKARTVVAEAAELAATCGSALLARQARDEQARLSARRSRRSPEGLTETEATVAVLASRGASNSEIAASLVVSVRTVESHLGRVYTKLGLQSRRQLMIRFPDGAGLAAGSAGDTKPRRDLRWP
jgi:DNA-binding CsgD family transcriptional regulator